MMSSHPACQVVPLTLATAALVTPAAQAKPVTRVGIDGVWEPAPHELVAEPRECASCGDEFLPPRRDALYCSHRCRQRAYRQRA
jgi:hypothetical protein